MSAYLKIKQLDPDGLELLKRLGYLKSTFRRNVSIYETYLKYRERGVPSTDAVVHTADDFGISDRHVFRIVVNFAEDESILG